MEIISGIIGFCLALLCLIVTIAGILAFAWFVIGFYQDLKKESQKPGRRRRR